MIYNKLKDFNLHTNHTPSVMSYFDINFPAGSKSSLPIGQDIMNILMSVVDNKSKPFSSGVCVISMDVSETTDSFVVECFLPGVSKENIKVTVKPNRILSITAESMSPLVAGSASSEPRCENTECGLPSRGLFSSPQECKARCDTAPKYPISHNSELLYGKFGREIILPANTDVTSCSSTFEGGVLRIVFAKRVQDEYITIPIGSGPVASSQKRV